MTSIEEIKLSYGINKAIDGEYDKTAAAKCANGTFVGKGGSAPHLLMTVTEFSRLFITAKPLSRPFSTAKELRIINRVRTAFI